MKSRRSNSGSNAEKQIYEAKTYIKINLEKNYLKKTKLKNLNFVWKQIFSKITTDLVL